MSRIYGKVGGVCIFFFHNPPATGMGETQTSTYKEKETSEKPGLKKLRLNNGHEDLGKGKNVYKENKIKDTELHCLK